MSQRADPTLIGGFVVGALALLLGGVLIFGRARLSSHVFPARLYFRENVSGLRVGAPVRFKGVDIGSVGQIQLVSREGSGLIDPPVLVRIDLDEQRIRHKTGATRQATNAELSLAIRQGLRAQLQIESVVTGILFIDLAFHPESPAVYFGGADAEEDSIELPTIPSSGEELKASLRSLTGKLDKMDIDGMVESLRETSDTIRELLQSAEVRDTLVHLEATSEEIRAASTRLAPLLDSLGQASTGSLEVEHDLRSVLAAAGELIAAIDRHVDPLFASLETAAGGVGSAADELTATARAARQSLAPDSPVIYELRTMLQQMSQTGQALELLLGLVERDPGVLLRGREQQGDVK